MRSARFVVGTAANRELDVMARPVLGAAAREWGRFGLLATGGRCVEEPRDFSQGRKGVREVREVRRHKPAGASR